MSDERSNATVARNIEEGPSSSSEMSEQEMLAELRERYLRMVSSLGGKRVNVDMHEKTQVSGKFVAMKADGSHFAVDSLQTPIGVIQHAILRIGDTLCIYANLEDITDSRFSEQTKTKHEGVTLTYNHTAR
ncbi:unnamed protein product [Toxocara canis]|uniref:Gem-associated protein 7 n=1 Tax=Toxocara canis TaxID=6265 RepID=A0A183V1M3_TOXCA|nr:unnamed protein product [Toxocara canis]